MKAIKKNIKKTIKKRIEIKQQMAFPKPTSGKRTIKKEIELIQQTKMGVRDKLRVGGTPPKSIPVDLVSRNEIRTGIRRGIEILPYQKKAFVDYDVVICIPSNDRYKKVKRLITQFYEQPTKYSFKIILLNDGSINKLYDNLVEQFPEVVYLKNEKPNGKVLHWYCYNQMWEHLKNINCHVILQMDDDFILSDNFLDVMVDMFFKLKEENPQWMAITPHLWSFKEEKDFESWWKRTDFVDGIALIDDIIIKNMDYGMKPVDADAVSKAGVPVRAWTQISEAIVSIGGLIYRTENSLVYHDGNDDSKLHSTVRGNGKGVFTQKYIGKL